MTAARKLVDPYPYEEQVAPPAIEAPQQKRSAKRRRLPATLKICLVAACCVAVSLLYLQQQVTSYYLNMELVELQEQVNMMQQRNDHIMLSVEAQRSLQQIEQIARTELGMVDPTYTAILVVSEPTLLAGEPEPVWPSDPSPRRQGPGIFSTLASWVNKVLPLGGVEAGTLQR
ncbi:MAG: septum formation initiator family protein [Bacillota bacterium]|jgi:cell division protein FtsL|nr:septum formation initiator family protein [Bacillota bacterium]